MYLYVYIFIIINNLCVWFYASFAQVELSAGIASICRACSGHMYYVKCIQYYVMSNIPCSEFLLQLNDTHKLLSKCIHIYVTWLEYRIRCESIVYDWFVKLGINYIGARAVEHIGSTSWRFTVCAMPSEQHPFN